jgi:hypothetical protein
MAALSLHPQILLTISPQLLLDDLQFATRCSQAVITGMGLVMRLVVAVVVAVVVALLVVFERFSPGFWLVFFLFSSNSEYIFNAYLIIFLACDPCVLNF